MNVNLLIDAIVRQTTVLIAQLATAAGARATLAHTANQVFADLVSELKTQGLGNKVIADMFGLTLRTYHHKMARLSESTTERGRSLWEALLAFVQAKKAVLRSDVLVHFAHDEEAKVRGVLKDLVDTGLLFRSGRGDSTLYRAADAEEYALTQANGDRDRLANIVWVAVYRNGPISRAALLEHVPADDAALDEALHGLQRDGRIRRAGDDEPARYESESCIIELGDEAGWEAAVFDHYQAVVTAICTKVRLGKRKASIGEWVGGSTYGFEVWEDHPYRDKVLGLLQEMRDRAVALRQDVAAYNAANDPGQGALRVISYVGQTVLGQEDADEEQTQ